LSPLLLTPIIDLLWLYDSPFRFRVGLGKA
jgi:hypothetical protein